MKAENRGQAESGFYRLVQSNQEAFDDLAIGGVQDQVFAAVPRRYEKSGVSDKEYLSDIFHNPVCNGDEIVQRQEAIAELQDDEDLWDEALAVKQSLDTCLYDERYRSAVNGLKSLQDAANIVDFVLAIRKMRKPVSKRLKRIKESGQPV